MDKLVKLISEKAGLDEKMAQQVVEIVVEYLKKNLPAPLNKNVEKLIGGEITDISQIAGLGGQQGGLGGLLGGLFGRKK
jgi:hypothetical protein